MTRGLAIRGSATCLWVVVGGCFPMMGCNDLTSETFLFVHASTVVDPFCGPGSCTDRALEGVEACETGTTNCVETDNHGVAAPLSLPPDEEVSFTAQKDGYEAKLFADVSDWGPGAPWRLGLRSNERAAAWHEHLESDYPMRGVGAVFVRLQPAFEGATFRLVDATGEPFYWVELPAVFPATVDRDLQATTSRGRGGFLNVAPGAWQIEIGGTAEHCVPNNAWPGDAENRIRFPVREGHVTWVTVTCSPP